MPRGPPIFFDSLVSWKCTEHHALTRLYACIQPFADTRRNCALFSVNSSYPLQGFLKHFTLPETYNCLRIHDPADAPAFVSHGFQYHQTQPHPLQATLHAFCLLIAPWPSLKRSFPFASQYLILSFRLTISYTLFKCRTRGIGWSMTAKGTRAKSVFAIRSHYAPAGTHLFFECVRHSRIGVHLIRRFLSFT